MSPGRRALVVLTLLLAATPAFGHVPTFPAENTSPDRAVEVPDADKSWSFYDRLAPGEVRYYRLSLDAGERLRVGTFTPRRGAFTPSVVVAGESVAGVDDVPPGVTVPEGMGAVVVEGERPAGPSYEPFAPSAAYHTARVDRPAAGPGTYLVAVYEPANRSGRVGVAVGSREAFSPAEYLAVPFDRVRIHRWEGQHPLVVLGPFLAVLAGGLPAVRRRVTGTTGPRRRRLALGVAGLFLVGSAANTAVGMGLALSRTGPTAAALVTAAFVAVPLGGGLWVLDVVGREDPPGRRTGVGLLVTGVAGLATWAGFVVGPAVLLAVGVAVLAPKWR